MLRLKAKTVLHGFLEIIIKEKKQKKTKRKPNKLWVDWERELNNSPKKNWLDNNDILMYSTHKEGKSIVT